MPVPALLARVNSTSCCCPAINRKNHARSEICVRQVADRVDNFRHLTQPAEWIERCQKGVLFWAVQGSIDYTGSNGIDLDVVFREFRGKRARSLIDSAFHKGRQGCGHVGVGLNAVAVRSFC